MIVKFKILSILWTFNQSFLYKYTEICLRLQQREYIWCTLCFKTPRESFNITEGRISFKTEWYIKDDLTQWFSNFTVYWNHKGVSQMLSPIKSASWAMGSNLQHCQIQVLHCTEEDKGKAENNRQKNKRKEEKWKARRTYIRGNNGKRYSNSKLFLLVSYELGKKPFPVSYICQIANKDIC